MNKSEPTVYIMVGVPASGKSTFISKSLKLSKLPLVSSDKYIEEYALRFGKTYSDVFNSEIKTAESQMYKYVDRLFKYNLSFVWDQTNLSIKSRAKKLAMVPEGYRKVAIWFEIPNPTELKRRLDSRPGKIIPLHVMNSMIQNFSIPSKSEGFDEIIKGN